MKNILILLLTLFSLQSFAQQKYVVKVQGTPGITKAQLDSTANLKLAITDTTNKWVNTLANNATNDSLIYWVGSVRHAIKVASNQVNSDWNASTGVSQILNKPTIPNATSQLTNDAGFITSASITGKADLSNTVTLTGADSISGVKKFSNSITIDKVSNGSLIFKSTNAPARSWSITQSGLVYGDLLFSQSTANNGDPINAGIPRIYLDASGGVGFGTTNVKIGDGTYSVQSAFSSSGKNGAVMALRKPDTTNYFQGIYFQDKNLNAGWIYGVDLNGNAIIGHGSGASETPAITNSRSTPSLSISPSGNISVPIISDAVGDFVTRNSGTGQLQIRTAAQTLSDIGALSSTGNAASATKLQTARNINGVPFDGTSNITVTDASKQPLEDQRLSQANDVTFKNVRAKTMIAVMDSAATAQGAFIYHNSAAKSNSQIFFLPNTSVDTLAAKSDLKGYIDTSFKQNLYAADPGTFINDSTFGLRQSFVDSLRNAGFTKKVFGMSLDGSNPVFGTDIVMNNHSSIWFNGSSNMYYYGLIPMNMYNGGLYFQIGSRDNIVMTPTGTSIDGINIPTAKLEIAASSGSAGDAPLKIDAGKLLSTPENGAIERDSATQRLYDTHLNKRELVAYTSDILSILSDSIGNRNYANDSIAVVDGKLSLHKFYRTGSDVKIVSTLPYFSALNYVIDATGANDSTQFQLHFNTSGLSFSVDWNDGKIDTISGFGAYAIVTHKYTTTGFYNPKIILNVGDAAKILEFTVNNYPYNSRITKVNNLAYLTAATNIDVSATQAIDSTTYDFAYPSTLTQLKLQSSGITKFHPTHNLPAGVTILNLGGNPFTSAELDNTFIWLDGQTFNAGTKNLYFQTGTSPTSASSAAIADLQSKGWVITHD